MDKEECCIKLTEKECQQALKDFTFEVMRNNSNTKWDEKSQKHVLKSRFQRQHDVLENLIDNYFCSDYELLHESVDKTEPNIHREINLIYFLRDMIPNCRIFRGFEDGYIVVDNYKEHRGLGSIINCIYTYKVIKEKGVNFMEPLDIIKEFYERGWVDNE